MISYEQVFKEMERQLTIARKTGDEREMRQALAAIRSLCEVGLGGSSTKVEQETPKVLKTPQVQSLTSLEAKPMEEDGANGGSLFDF